jgi:hypothetical protein
MAITRRELLRTSRNWLMASGLSTLCPGLQLFSKTALAADLPSKADGYFVLLRTFGGMDCTLGLDPWVLPAGADEQDLFLEYREDEIVEASGLRLAPAAKALTAHAKDCLILNGVMMRRDAGHDVDNLYLLTGAGDGKAASIPVELAFALGAGPFGVVVDGPVYLAGKAASITSTADLVSQGDQDKLVQFIEERLKLQLAQQGTPWEQAQQDLVASQESVVRFMKVLKDLQASGESIGAYHVAAAALASGGAKQAQIEVPVPQPGLDTHGGHPGVHLGVQTSIWNFVSDVFSLFKKIPHRDGNLFDATTFMVMSEFSRTPGLNAAKGKDHNPFTNSVLLAGRGINGGKVVGASKLIPRKQTGTELATHMAHPFNYETGTLATQPTGASFFFPENLVRTIGDIFGDSPTFLPVPKTIKPIPGIVKTPSRPV